MLLRFQLDVVPSGAGQAAMRAVNDPAARSAGAEGAARERSAMVVEQVGVILVHGIGEQRRFEHLDGQLRALIGALDHL
ncbi:MAG TPA: hypothetical protein VMQ99_09655 [Acetobacteraceae bacterium]|nr:hypothetical protein [Acetobacteraceae bacterium]